MFFQAGVTNTQLENMYLRTTPELRWKFFLRFCETMKEIGSAQSN